MINLIKLKLCKTELSVIAIDNDLKLTQTLMSCELKAMKLLKQLSQRKNKHITSGPPISIWNNYGT